jgi:polyisoprenoid-binding protein YceI
MSRVLAAVVLALAGPVIAADLGQVPSGRYAADPGHRFISFSYSHLGLSHPMARITDFDAVLTLDSAQPQNSMVEATIRAAGISSGFAPMDREFHGATLFDVAAFPEIKFTSTALTRTSADAGTMTGNLTIKGITKPVSLAVKLNGAGPHPMTKKPAVGFSATGTLKRSDWGLTRSVPAVGNEITLAIEAEFHAVP